MANVHVEARPKGRPEGSRIDDYVVEEPYRIDDAAICCVLLTK